MKDKKRCNRCDVEKPVCAFQEKKNARDGLAGHCRECEKAYQQAYRKKNRERLRQSGRNNYVNNREAYISRAAHWRAANPERHRELQNLYYERHIERERMRARVLQHSRRRDAPFDHEAKGYAKLILADPCAYCGASAAHVDHIVPISAGGKSTWDNLAPACAICNRQKNAKPLLHFLLAKNVETLQREKK